MNSIKRFFQSLLIILSFSFFQVNGVCNIIFDLGETLLTTDKKAAFKLLWPQILWYVASGNNPHQAQKIFMRILHHIEPLKKPEIYLEDGHGNRLAQLMINRLKSDFNTREAIAKIEHYCDTHPEEFTGPAEAKLVKAIAHIAFDPKLLITTQKCIPEAVAFAQECKQRGHKLYILSNWDAQSWDLITKSYPELYALFDGAIISGKVASIKPEPEIYQILLATYNLNPHECIFIDDLPENLKIARTLGIHTIQCKKIKPSWQNWWQSTYNYDTIRKEYHTIINKLYAQFAP